jgi:hypothetical protein
LTQQQTAILAGVFQGDAQVKEAINALKSAGFAYDQVGVASRNAGAATLSLSNDLMGLGMPQEQATYYEHEFNAGRTVVSVRPDGREAEVKNIFTSNGAYEFGQRGPTGAAPTHNPAEGQPGNIPSYSQADGANYNPPGSQHNQPGNIFNAGGSERPGDQNV